MLEKIHNNFREKMKREMKEKNEILILQSRLEKGEILEESLTEKQKAELEKLYDEQIRELKEKIEKEEYNLKLKEDLIRKYIKMLKKDN